MRSISRIRASVLAVALALLAAAPIVAPALAQSTQSLPFRRMSEPVQAAVGPTARATMVPPASLRDPMNGLPLPSFYVANPNQVWVRLKGFTNAADCQSIGVTETTG